MPAPIFPDCFNPTILLAAVTLPVESSSQSYGKFSWRHRLHERLSVLFQQFSLLNKVIRVAAGKNDFYVVFQLPDFKGGLSAIYIRHYDIHQYQINLVLTFTKNLNCLPPIMRKQHPVPQGRQKQLQILPDSCFVIYDQNGFVST